MSMKSKLLHEADGQKTFAIILEPGDEAMACLKDFARAEGLTAASFTAIGAFERAELAYFDWEAKQYCPIPVAEQAEVASFIGDVVRDKDDEPVVHVHVVLGLREGTALAGHLQRGVVRPTLEIILTESPVHIRKCPDRESGIALIDLEAD